MTRRDVAGWSFGAFISTASAFAPALLPDLTYWQSCLIVILAVAGAFTCIAMAWRAENGVRIMQGKRPLGPSAIYIGPGASLSHSTVRNVRIKGLDGLLHNEGSVESSTIEDVELDASTPKPATTADGEGLE